MFIVIGFKASGCTWLMKVLVYGTKGWIGSQFVGLLDSYVEGMARVDSVNQVREEIVQVMPTHVISCIGRMDGVINGVTYSSVEYLEHKGKLVDNVRDNLAGPMILAKLCEERRIHFTYIGTGCIFDTDNNHVRIGYTETDNATFFGSSYSIVKGYTDMLMKLYPVLHLRIHMPITSTPHPHNFLTKLQYPSSLLNSMTVLPDVLPIIYDLMEKGHVGTLNLTNPGYISSNEIVEMYREIVDPNFTCIETVGEQSTMLDTSLIETMYCIPTIHESVRAMLYEYKQKIGE
jgi:3,5-epimerase/4-reductase